MNMRRTTVRRDYIRKMIEAGRVMIKTDMILTDDYAFDNAYNCQKSDWVKADIKDFHDMDFRYKSGYASKNPDGTISWTMLCNHYYTIKII